MTPLWKLSRFFGAAYAAEHARGPVEARYADAVGTPWCPIGEASSFEEARDVVAWSATTLGEGLWLARARGHLWAVEGGEAELLPILALTLAYPALHARRDHLPFAWPDGWEACALSSQLVEAAASFAPWAVTRAALGACLARLLRPGRPPGALDPSRAKACGVREASSSRMAADRIHLLSRDLVPGVFRRGAAAAADALGYTWAWQRVERMPGSDRDLFAGQEGWADEGDRWLADALRAEVPYSAVARGLRAASRGEDALLVYLQST